MAERRALFRCDAGATMGGGHVMRCLTLADAMAATGWTCDFAVAPETLDIVTGDRFGDHGLKILGDPFDPEMTPDGYDLAVIDHYGLNASYETGLRHAARRIAVLDDFPTRPHDCDLLIDQNYGRTVADYRGVIPAAATALCGTDFALLRPAFPALREAALARRGGGAAGRVLVSLGLTDVGGVTGDVMERLLAMETGVAFDVVIGPAAPSRERLTELAARDDVTLHIATDDMAALMAAADICVGAGGTTSWERCCLGLPTVLLVLADNQRDIAASLDEAGAATALSAWNGGEVEAALSRLLGDHSAREAMARAASMLCDGGGAERAAAELTALAARTAGADGPLRARDADGGDCADLWLWRNHPKARAVSLSADEIPWEGHRDWFAASLSRDDRVILMVERAGAAIGYVRFDRQGDAWLVSIALAPHAHGGGMGASALAAGVGAMQARGHLRFRADIHNDNVAAQRIFAACGFARLAPREGGFDHYEMNGSGA